MELISRFVQKSKELKSILEEKIIPEQRDSMVQRVEKLLFERQQILNSLRDLSTLDESIKLDLVTLEKEIETLMKNHKEKIKHDLKILQLKRQKENQYSNPYENLSIDGMFLDKKK